MFPITVIRKTGRCIETGRTACDNIENRRRNDRTRDLYDPVSEHVAQWETTRHCKSEGHSGIKMCAGDVTKGVSAGEYSKPEGEGHARIADAQIGHRRCEHRTSATAQHQPSGSQEFGNEFACHAHRATPTRIIRAAVILPIALAQVEERVHASSVLPRAQAR